jgi:hypothetical protein
MVTPFSMATHGPAGPSAAELLSRRLFGPDAAARHTWEAGREAVSTGFRPLDRLLPAGGVRRGSLIEWLAADDASGAVALACAVACRLAAPRSARHATAGSEAVAARPATTIMVVDRGGRFHPPAVLPWLEAMARDGAARDGSDGTGRRPQLVVARPSTDDDELWAIDQSLRCPGVAAVLAWPGRVHPTAMRRWQLAARSGGAVGLLVRGMSPGTERGRRCEHHGAVEQAGMAAQTGLVLQPRMPIDPTWAEARVAVQPLPPSSSAGEPPVGASVRRLRLSLVGGPWAGEAMLQERATELFLDMQGGCEAVGRRAASGSPGATRLRDWDGMREGRECRAS